MSASNYYEVINTKMYISHCCMCQEIKSKNYPRARIKELLVPAHHFLKQSIRYVSFYS